MRFTVVIFLASIAMALPAHAQYFQRESAFGNGTSGYIQYNSAAGFGGAQFHIKNDGATSLTTRKGYFRFDTSGLSKPVDTVQFEMAVYLIDSAIGANDQTFHVYGITNQALDAVPLTNGLTWADAPANNTSSPYEADLAEAQLLGTFSFSYDGANPSTTGNVVRFSSSALTDLYNNDTNNAVTLIIGRTGTLDEKNLLFAGDSHASFAPPTLSSLPIQLLNSDYALDATSVSDRTEILSFNAGANSEKLVVSLCGEGGNVASITYNGQAMTQALGKNFRFMGIYYLDDPYTGGSANIEVTLSGLNNGLLIGAYSLSGTTDGYDVATVQNGASNVTVSASSGYSFAVAAYADQADGDAESEYPLTTLYGGLTGSAKAAMATRNGVPSGANTFTFSGSGGSPEAGAAIFKAANSSGIIFIIR
jgi:hypothetical protein